MLIKLNFADIKIAGILKHSISRDILLSLGKNPKTESTLSELARSLGIPPTSGILRKAVNSLLRAGLITERTSSRGRYLKINAKILELPDNTENLIPQPEYRKIVHKVVERIEKMKGIRRIILYGGVARGMADRLSDIDIMLVVKDPLAISDDVSRLIYDCSAGKVVPERYNVSIKLITEDDYQNPKGFIKGAKLEGITLYGGE